MTKKNMQIESEATVIEERMQHPPRMREITAVNPPAVVGIVGCYLLEENESGQIKESNYAAHTTL